jgi:hypothetical protein
MKTAQLQSLQVVLQFVLQVVALQLEAQLCVACWMQLHAALILHFY